MRGVEETGVFRRWLQGFGKFVGGHIGRYLLKEVVLA